MNTFNRSRELYNNRSLEVQRNNINKNYKSLPIKGGGDHKQRPHAGNSLRKTQMANENLQI